jgi:hypothetical protein
MIDQGSGLEANPSWVRRHYSDEASASKLKGKTRKIIKFVFDEIF